jgi:hypothetical protein
MAAGNCASNVPAKRLYSIKEMVSHFGATVWFWRTQIWAGQLAYVQVGRKMLVDHKDVEQFIQNNKSVN